MQEKVTKTMQSENHIVHQIKLIFTFLIKNSLNFKFDNLVECDLCLFLL